MTPDHTTSSDAGRLPAVSVIVCTHNGSRTLNLALDALAVQTIGRERMELIVVDDASTDDSGELARSVGARVVRREQSRGLASARNAGIAAAQGEILVFTDDDVEPEPDWLEELLTPFGDPAVEGVTGRTASGSEDSIVFRYLAARNPLRPLPATLLTTRSPLQRLMNYLRTETGPSPSIANGSRVYALVGANMAIRASLMDELGGFDPGFVQSEDEDLSRRAQNLRGNNANFVYQDSAFVRHHYRPGLKDTLRRAKIYGEGNAHTSLEKGVQPAIYPFPFAVVLVLAAAVVRRPRGVPLAVLAPLAIYWRWVAFALARRNPEPALYPYIQLLQEAWTMYGEARYLRSR